MYAYDASWATRLDVTVSWATWLHATGWTAARFSFATRAGAVRTTIPGSGCGRADGLPRCRHELPGVLVEHHHRRTTRSGRRRSGFAGIGCLFCFSFSGRTLLGYGVGRPLNRVREQVLQNGSKGGSVRRRHDTRSSNTCSTHYQNMYETISSNMCHTHCENMCHTHIQNMCQAYLLHMLNGDSCVDPNACMQA